MLNSKVTLIDQSSFLIILAVLSMAIAIFKDSNLHSYHLFWSPPDRSVMRTIIFCMGREFGAYHRITTWWRNAGELHANISITLGFPIWVIIINHGGMKINCHKPWVFVGCLHSFSVYPWFWVTFLAKKSIRSSLKALAKPKSMSFKEWSLWSL